MDLLGLGIILGSTAVLLFTPHEHFPRIAHVVSIVIGSVLILGSHYKLFVGL